MRGPDSLPRWVTSDDLLADEPEPISATVCPCCLGTGHHSPAAKSYCPTMIAVLMAEMKAGLAGTTTGNGWINQGEEAANTPGCARCGDSGVVAVDLDTEDVL